MKKNIIIGLFGSFIFACSMLNVFHSLQNNCFNVSADIGSAGHLSFSKIGNNSYSFYAKTESEPAGISSSWDVPYFGSITYSNSSIVGYSSCQIKYYEAKSVYVELIGYSAFQVLPQAGDTVTIGGVFSTTGDTPSSFNIEATKFTYEYGVWATVTYKDEELETYDRVTLRDVGLGESVVLDGQKAFDYELNDVSKNYVANNALNTTGSMVLSFGLEYATKPSGRLTFRLRGSSIWTGFNTFIDFDNDFIQIYDDETHSSWAYGKCDLSVGSHVVEYGAIDIKDSNNTWLYAVVDNVRVFSVAREKVSSYNTTRIGVYAPKTVVCSLTSTGSKGEFVNKISTSGFTLTERDITNSTAKGVYFHLNENDIPYIDGDWSYPCYLLEKEALSINGIAAKCTSGIIKKTGESSYYLCLSDNGITAEENNLYVLDGVFSMAFNAKKYVFSIQDAAVRYFEGKWSVVSNPRNELVEKLNLYVDEDLYDKTNIQTVREIVTAATSGIAKAYNFVDANAIYAKAIIELDKVPMDEEAYKEKLAQYKIAAKAVLASYAAKKQYSETNQAKVDQIVETAYGEIDAAINKSAVDIAVEKAKGKIDLIMDLYQEVEDSILNQKEGFEVFLDQYDVASLNDVNWGDSFAINEYPTSTPYLDGENSLSNTFIGNTNNQNGNVIFQFKIDFSENCKNKYSAVASLRLRGIQYFAYRFDVGYNGQNPDFVDGIRVFRIPSDPAAKQIAFKNDVFTEPNKQYSVQIGAVDIKGFDKVWLFAKVDGNLVLNAITDKIDFCTNQRVSISDSYTLENSGSHATLFNDSSATTCCGNIEDVAHARSSTISSTASDVVFDMPQNSIPVNSSFAPLSKQTIKYNGEEKADNTATSLTKISENAYSLNISKLGVEPKEGDVLLVNGSFASFIKETGKFGLTIKDATFKFVGGVWKYQLSLEQAKQIGIEEINNYVDLNDYTETNKLAIQEIIANGTKSINDAKTVEEVEQAVALIKSQIDAIPSILSTYKQTKKEELRLYKENDMGLYRDAQKQEINKIKTDAYAAIDKADNQGAVDVIVFNAKNNINAVKTAEQLDKEELAVLKEESLVEVRKIYNTLDLSNYTKENIDVINKLVLDAQNQIRNATTKDDVNNAVTNFKNKLDAVPKIKNTSGGCGGSIVTTSVTLSILALTGIALILLKKRKNKCF